MHDEQLIPKYRIGQTVFRAHTKYKPFNDKKCPYCFGTHMIETVSTSGKKFSVKCAFCFSYKALTAPEEEIITKILITRHYIKYIMEGGVYYREDELFLLRTDALLKSKELAKSVNNRRSLD